MRIDQPPRFALMLGSTAWQRAAFDANTALIDGVVQLAWGTQGEGGTPSLVPNAAGAGLAFDGHCRLYHSVPAQQRVERWLWDAFDPAWRQNAAPESQTPADVLVDRQPVAQVIGALPSPSTGFAPAAPLPPAFTPRALACDGQDHLYVLDTLGHQVWVVDLQQRRVLRAEPVAAGAVDIAWHAGWLWVLVANGALQRLSAVRPAQAVTAAGAAAVAAPAGASRLAFAGDGRLFVLTQANTAAAAVFELGRPGRWLAAPAELVVPGDPPFAWASGLAVSGCADHDQHLVVARRCEELFSRVDLAGTRPYALAEPLTARRYDGLGIAAAPDGRIAFWTAKGARHATAARLHYRSPGRVIGFRLDAGVSHSGQPSWGRIFFDACVPANTSLRVQCIVGDDDIDADRVPRTPPANQALTAIAQPEQTPLPLQVALPGDDTVPQLLCKRSDGSEQPWLVEAERFDTFEAIAPALQGRYLWLVIDLIGHSRATPKLRSVRVECPAHDWLRLLPQLYSRQDGMRQFLQRYLSPAAGLCDDLAAQSDSRHALVKPCSTPATVLPWLARWVGLTLDERWSETARRSFIQQAPQLFRLRGTLWSLRRMLEIVTGARVVIVEQFRLRGLGRLGPDPHGQGWDEPAVLGLGFRVGGPLGRDDVQGAAADIADSFSNNAHRFTVLVQADLDAQADASVRHLLDVHRPAHTLYTLCSLGRGSRIGRGLQVGLSTVVGKSGGFAPLQLGAGTLGKTQVLGRPVSGLRPGTAVLGRAARIT